MTLESQMTRPVTIVHRSPSVSVDGYGNPLNGTDSTSDALGYFEQTSEQELVVGQETYTSDGLLMLPALTPLDGSDRVVIDGVTYEVVGQPSRPWRPRTGEHHVEARLRVSTG